MDLGVVDSSVIVAFENVIQALGMPNQETFEDIEGIKVSNIAFQDLNYGLSIQRDGQTKAFCISLNWTGESAEGRVNEMVIRLLIAVIQIVHSEKTRELIPALVTETFRSQSRR